MFPLIAIVGPTGSGKTELALNVAQRFSGEIVNCDSLQLYQGFDVGTAKTPRHLRRDIPHHLFDVLTPQKSYSAGDYAREARLVIAEISRRGKLPVLAGGTGFYLKALLDGLPELPPRDELLRARLLAKEFLRAGSLHRLLRRLDPSSAAKIAAGDVQKTARALEIRLLTQSPRPAPASAGPLQGYRVLQLGLSPDRADLARSIEARTRAMFDHRLIEEVRQLLASGLTGNEKPFESLGYKQTLAYLRGNRSLEDAIEATIIATRQYAKRQMTWFRRDPQIQWLPGFGSSPAIAELALDAVRAFLTPC